MAITNIKVTSYDNATNIGNVTPTMFMKGDQLKIDCYNNKVYLNDKIFNQISIDSGYIGLVSGNNDIKVTSDDTKIVWAVMFNERHV
jgi:phage-related protein